MWLLCPSCCGIYNSVHIKSITDKNHSEIYYCPFSECDNVMLKQINPLIDKLIFSMSDLGVHIADVDLSIQNNEQSYIIFFSSVEEELKAFEQYIQFISKYKRLKMSEITGKNDRYVLSVVATNLDESLDEKLEATSELIKFLVEFNSHLLEEAKEL